MNDSHRPDEDPAADAPSSDPGAEPGVPVDDTELAESRAGRPAAGAQPAPADRAEPHVTVPVDSDLAEADASAGGSAGAGQTQGMVADLEDGLGHLLASFEKGMLSFLGGGRSDADDPDETGGGSSGTPAPADRSRQRSSGASPEPVDRPIPPGRTYEEVARPLRWRSVLLGLLAVVVLAALYVAMTFVQVWQAADDDERQSADAIVVLGAAQFDGEPSPVLRARLDHAWELWSDGLADTIVTTGSNQEGDRFTEGFSGFVHLRDRGVPESQILLVVDGADTWEQLSATAVQFEDRELTSALLVSDGYHNFRLREIADEVGIEAWVSPTGTQATTRDYLRETAAVSIGRLVGFRRLSDNAPG